MFRNCFVATLRNTSTHCNGTIVICHKNVQEIWKTSMCLYSAANNYKEKQSFNGIMKAWQIDSYGDLSNLKLSDVSSPVISHPCDVLVKVFSSSINSLDVAMIGGYGKTTLDMMRCLDKAPWGHSSYNTGTFPLTVGRDFTGEVVGLGRSVRGVSLGDRVWGVADTMSQGCHAEYVVTNSRDICPISDSISNTDGASLPFVALTGWSAVVFSGGIKPENAIDKTVLILGASGGVGTFLTQLLSFWGAQVIGVCKSESFGLVQSCGAIEVHDYQSPDTEDLLTSNQRFDLIVDATGQSDVKWMKGLRKHTGASFVTLTSPLLRNMDEIGFPAGLVKSIGQIVKPNVCSFSEGRCYKWAYFMPNHKVLKRIAKLTAEGKIRPIVDKIYAFENATEGYEHVANGKPRGKIVLDFSGTT